jgi:CDP-diacylglycerol--glycerol-3-phosphate 3-phosphatidyltransferase
LAAGVVFAVAALTDYLDGFLARRWRVSTATGSFLDTTADKVLVTAALVGLVAIGRTSAWAVLVIVGREMVIMGLRASAALQGVLIVASQLGRVKAAIQFVAILVSLLNLDQRVGPVGLDQWVMLAAVLITFGSGVDYLVRFSRASLTKSGQSAGR